MRGRTAEDLAAHPAWRAHAGAPARVHVARAPADALAHARARAGTGGLVLVTGSLYLAGAVRHLA